jgi:YVTN family beta-propeller protein
MVQEEDCSVVDVMTSKVRATISVGDKPASIEKKIKVLSMF